MQAPFSQRPRLTAHPSKRKAVISLTPLIDVVFILLVFFMLSSSFLDWRHQPLGHPRVLVPAQRFELWTHRLRVGCSSQLS